MQTLFYNAKIYTLASPGERYAAMLVDRNGRVAGLYAEHAPLPPASRRIDLRGGTIVPGFIDAHAHLMSKAFLDAVAIRLFEVKENRVVPDSLEAVHELLSGMTGYTRGPVVGYGLCIGALKEQRLPYAEELDLWFPGRPAVVFSLDGHSSTMLHIKIKTTKGHQIRWPFTLLKLVSETIRTAGLVFRSPDFGGMAPGHKTRNRIASLASEILYPHSLANICLRT